MDSIIEKSSDRVLIIGARRDQLPDDARAYVADAGRALEVCQDVYRGLARAVRDAPLLILVCVDCLISGEFEFFRVVSRGRNVPPVLVWSRSGNRRRIQWALDAGATGELTRERVAAVMPGPGDKPSAALPDPDSPATPASDDLGVSESADIVNPSGFASPDNVFDSELDDRLNRAVDATLEAAPHRPATAPGADGNVDSDATGIDEPMNRCDETKQPTQHELYFTEYEATQFHEQHGTDSDQHAPAVRVPWKNYTDRPRRTPPRPAYPNEPRFHYDTRNTGDVNDDTPLLTDEELEALLGRNPRK